jgi:predicted nucleic acid-binding protein
VIVLDTSAALECLVGVDTDPRLKARVAGARSLHVPHLFDVEMLSALRGLVLGRKVSDQRAQDAVTDCQSLRLLRYPMSGLTDRVWARRHTTTAYDATFVALAEALQLPLVTCDERLARSIGEGVDVELFSSRGQGA